MISCNELRVGNYVMVNDDIHIISMINNNDTFSSSTVFIKKDGLESSANASCKSSNLQPIPLTDKLLEECFFKFHRHFKFWQLITINDEKQSEMDIDVDYSVIDFMRRPVVKRITSLHQLQNIYFALKGNELKVNLKESVD
ncbi:MAG: hypothetical protein ACM3VS_09930 [Candidatus Dadabacteria bacterium]